MDFEVLEQSFQEVKDRGHEFAATFYNNLLGDYPQLQPLFAGTKMEEQGKLLFGSVRYVVNNLHNPENLQKALTGLGTRHVKYGVLPEHYPLVGNSLLKTFATYMNWTPEVEKAWIEAYAVITQIMLEGADYPPEILQLSK